MSAHDIYAEQLRERRRGTPLYYPEPHPEDGAVEIGDLGYIREGAFQRILNVTRPPGDPAQRFGVPDDFERLDIGAVRTFDGALEPGPVHSKTVSTLEANVGTQSSAVLPAEASFHFKCSSNRGAILILESEMSRASAVQTARFERYLRQHYLSFLAFAKSLDINLAFGDLMLVVECSKTAAWSSAVYANSDREFSLQFSVGNPFQPSSLGFSVVASVERVGSVDRRRSRRRALTSDPPLSNDHTVFLKAFRLGTREAYLHSTVSLFMKARDSFFGDRRGEPRSNKSRGSNASAGGTTPPSWGAPSSSGTENYSDGMIIRPDGLDYHPSIPLLGLAMESSDADIAIVHDDVWCLASVDSDEFQLIEQYTEFYFNDSVHLTQSSLLRTSSGVADPFKSSRPFSDSASILGESTNISWSHPSSSSAMQKIGSSTMALPESSQDFLAPTPTAAHSRDRWRSQSRDRREEDKPKETAKTIHGACARCKKLKVRCQFETYTDPCKRCLNGGHDCIIPNRKSRRMASKREHLLDHTRAQAAFGTADADFFHSILVPAVLSYAEVNPTASTAVVNWITKAKQIFGELDVSIGIGDAGMPKSHLAAGDLEHSESDEHDEYVNISDTNRSDYQSAIENRDEEDVTTDRSTPRHKASSSSLGTSGSGVSGRPRKHSGESAQPAIFPGYAAPFGLFGDLSFKTSKDKRRSSAEVEEDAQTPGGADADFLQSTLALEAFEKPLGIVTSKEAEELFQTYFDRMNPSVSLLDPVLYTAQRTCHRSPFLFTTICAIASRSYSQRPELYPRMMHHARKEAANALISGPKNVDTCQAYLLLSLYPVPTESRQDQRSWLYLGLAIRIATELNLHLPNTAKPQNELHAREILNRTRCWLNCFNLDQVISSQSGKPPIISSAYYMANHCEDWWKSSPYNMKDFDVQICAYNAELKVMAGFLAKIHSDPNHPTGLNKNLDLEKIAAETDDELKQLGAKWMAILETTDMTDPQNRFRTGLLRLVYPFARLVALSYGSQYAVGRSNTDESPLLRRCLDAASDVLPCLDDLCRPTQKIYLQHGPEVQRVLITCASAFLVKFLQPKFNPYLTVEKRVEICAVVRRVVDRLNSLEFAIDDRYGTQLYAKFLLALLTAPMAQVDPNSPSNAIQKAHASANNQESTEAAPDTHATYLDRSSHIGTSPAPREEALSFVGFALGALEPYASSTGAYALAMHLSCTAGGPLDMSDFFQSMPSDDAIMPRTQAEKCDPDSPGGTDPARGTRPPGPPAL
ncbi:putative fungal specific transcription factor [Lyophyllum shimeji]|uniref:Fungal specific transcription factor n=1 Tax=Lyophyllum shimeji TaxID=47721 RepID=A0A9P3PRQ9_LYOSH|nr:putative fungal specific transcription factor [Lyophyllum shimeji]